MNGNTNIAHPVNLPMGPRGLMPSFASLEREMEEVKQENARLKAALRELRHRSCNQWQMLLGLAEMEYMQHPQSVALGGLVRLSALTSAFATLNGTPDINMDVLAGNQHVCVRSALESIRALLHTTATEHDLHFAVEDFWIDQKRCTALMVICAELVCNAVKYGRQTAHVTFCTQFGQGILEVRDDGPGFPSGFRIEEQARHGLQLVAELCQFDLQGELRCRNDADGGVVTVTFPWSGTPREVALVTANESFCAMEGVICFDRLPASSL